MFQKQYEQLIESDIRAMTRRYVDLYLENIIEDQFEITEMKENFEMIKLISL
jgi:hypothetical protein